MMKCEYCDNPVPSGVTRCPSCGAVVSVVEGQTIQGGRMRSTQPVVHTPNLDPYTGAYAGIKPLELKNKWVYILLGFFLGELGIHNFYTGYIGRGVVKLLITILSFGLLFWIPWIWAIIEICTVRIDARGRPFENQMI